MVLAASYPPLQKTQERGTHSLEMGKKKQIRKVAPPAKHREGRATHCVSDSASSKAGPPAMVSSMVSAASYPPSQKTQERGTHSLEMGREKQDAKGWATLYNRVGVVKRHLDPREVLKFLFVEGFGFVLALGCCFCSLLMRPRPAFRILRWKFGSTNHLSGH